MAFRPFLPLLLLAALGTLSGCVGVDGSLTGSLDCSVDVDDKVASGDTLYPPFAAQEGRGMANNPTLGVHARRGQDVMAQVAYSGSGAIRVAYEGPAGTVTNDLRGAWTLVALDVPRDTNVTLTLVGDPFAAGVDYAMHLTATGCTPR